MAQGKTRYTWLVCVAALGILASVALEFLPCESASRFLRATLRFIAVLVAAVPALYSLHRSEQRAAKADENRLIAEEERTRAEAASAIQRLLVAAITILFRDEAPEAIRSNFMLADQGYLTVLIGTDTVKLYGDDRLKWAIDQGCCGAAWAQAVTASPMDDWKPVIAPSVSPARAATWNMTREQVRGTPHILWVVSIPVFHKSASGETRTFLGVLNFDGVQRPLKNPGRIEEHSFIGECATFAETIGRCVVDGGFVVFEGD
jgi:hypothetical protein